MRAGEGGDGKRGCGAEGLALTAAFPAPAVPSPGWDSPTGRHLPSSPGPPRNPGPGVGAGSGVPQAAAPAARSPGPCPGPAGARRGHPASSRPLPSSWAPSASPGRRPPPCSQVRAGAAGARAGSGQVNGGDGLPPFHSPPSPPPLPSIIFYCSLGRSGKRKSISSTSGKRFQHDTMPANRAIKGFLIRFHLTVRLLASTPSPIGCEAPGGCSV